MKISIIVPNLTGGGAEKVAINLANYYSSLGYKIDLVLFKKYGAYIDLLNDNVNVVDLNISRSRYSIISVRNYLKKNKTNIILSVKRDVNIIVGIASFGLNIKRIFYREANTLDDVLNMKFISRMIYLILMKITYLKAKYIIANSNDTKDDLVKNKIVNENKIKVIVNPVLPLEYKDLLKMDCSHKWLNNKELKVILSVGRLHKQKDFPFLIECFSEVIKHDKLARLVIVGEGDEKEYLLSLIKDLNLNDFIDIVNFQSNIFPYYMKARIFALTSKWEGFGNVIVEALSAGTTVVCTNCTGGPKMILENGKYGHLIELNDKYTFSNILLNELNNSIKKDDKLINYSEKFTVQKVAKLYLELMTN